MQGIYPWLVAAAVAAAAAAAGQLAALVVVVALVLVLVPALALVGVVARWLGVGRATSSCPAAVGVAVAVAAAAADGPGSSRSDDYSHSGGIPLGLGPRGFRLAAHRLGYVPSASEDEGPAAAVGLVVVLGSRPAVEEVCSAAVAVIAAVPSPVRRPFPAG